MARKRTIDPMAKRRDETDLQYRSRIARAKETKRRQGEDVVTPERLEKGDLVRIGGESGEIRSYNTRSTSSLARLNERGVLTDDQLASAQEIAMIPERLACDVTVKGSSYGHRVDCEGRTRDFGIESLNRVRMERAYSVWRLRLPLPRRLVLDMVIEDRQLASIARRHHTGWRKAIVVLRDALDMWADCKREAYNAINQDDVDDATRRIA